MTDLLTGPLARGPRGYPGLYPYAEWTARAYPRHSVVAHLNCIWHANTTTTQEPAFGFDGTVSSADWDLWLDARGANEASDAATAAEAARGQAEDAAAEAVVTLGTVRTIERRIRAQDLGDFATDADALAWAASQMPPISVVVGSSYWNTTSSIKRICSSTSSVPLCSWTRTPTPRRSARTRAFPLLPLLLRKRRPRLRPAAPPRARRPRPARLPRPS